MVTVSEDKFHTPIDAIAATANYNFTTFSVTFCFNNMTVRTHQRYDQIYYICMVITVIGIQKRSFYYMRAFDFLLYFIITMLQAGRLRVRIPMRSLDFF
jgi:hypothetical protein